MEQLAGPAGWDRDRERRFQAAVIAHPAAYCRFREAGGWLRRGLTGPHQVVDTDQALPLISDELNEPRIAQIGDAPARYGRNGRGEHRVIGVIASLRPGSVFGAPWTLAAGRTLMGVTAATPLHIPTKPYSIVLWRG